MHITFKPLVLILIATTLNACGGPLGPFAGGKLSGEEATSIDGIWSQAKDIEVIQLETRPANPHSINIWIGVVDDQIYLPTSLILGDEEPMERAWVQHVTEDPHVRLRINNKIYRATAVKVTDQALAQRVKETILKKYAEEATPHSDKAWVYRLSIER